MAKIVKDNLKFILTVAIIFITIVSSAAHSSYKIGKIQENTDSRIGTLEKDCNNNNIHTEEIIEKLGIIQQDLAEIKTDIKWLKKKNGLTYDKEIDYEETNYSGIISSAAN